MRKKELQKQVAALEKERNELTRAGLTLTKEHNRLQALHEGQKKIIQTERETREHLEGEYETLKEAHRELQGDLARLDKNNANQAYTITGLQNESKQIRAKLADARGTIGVLTHEKTALQNQAVNLRDQKTRQLETIQTLRDQLAEAQRQNRFWSAKEIDEKKELRQAVMDGLAAIAAAADIVTDWPDFEVAEGEEIDASFEVLDEDDVIEITTDLREHDPDTAA